MKSDELHLHYVCTLAEARQLIGDSQEFWVENCGCRNQNGPCNQSRTDICLSFRKDAPSWDLERRQLTREEVDELLIEAVEKRLVTRPFRDMNNKPVTDGICFCCKCCCDYFRDDAQYPCDKGTHVEETDPEICIHCGTCEEYCYFKARLWDGEELRVDLDKCYGCGVCVEMCSEEAIRME